MTVVNLGFPWEFSYVICLLCTLWCTGLPITCFFVIMVFYRSGLPPFTPTPNLKDQGITLFSPYPYPVTLPGVWNSSWHTPVALGVKETQWCVIMMGNVFLSSGYRWWWSCARLGRQNCRLGGGWLSTEVALPSGTKYGLRQCYVMKCFWKTRPLELHWVLACSFWNSSTEHWCVFKVCEPIHSQGLKKLNIVQSLH